MFCRRGLGGNGMARLRRRLLNKVHRVLLEGTVWMAIAPKPWRILFSSPWPEVRIMRWINGRLAIFLLVRGSPLRHWTRLEGNMCASIGNRPVVKIRRLEDNTLIVSFALAFTFDAVLTNRPLFTALNATLTTSQATGLGPFPR